MRDGVIFPPVVIFYDGQTRWLAEGFHRIAAAKQAGFTSISVTVIEGNERDAMLHSLGSNADHGKRRTNADKRYVVETMLKDDQWSAWSDREIGERCKVTHPFVAGIRKSLIPVSLETLPVSEVTKERTFTTKHGTTATMRTGNIGKPKKVVNPIDSFIKLAVSKVFDEMDGELSDEAGIDLAMSHILNGLGNANSNAEPESVKPTIQKTVADNVCELIETHNIPAEYHVELIEAAEGWAVNSDASNREGTSVAVKGFIWWDEKSGALAKRRIRVGEEAKNEKLLKKFGEYPFETTTFHFLENLRVGNSGPMADLKRCAEHFDSLDRERLERFKKILADIRQAHNEGMDELESSIDALLRSVEKDITPTDKLLTNT